MVTGTGNDVRRGGGVALPKTFYQCRVTPDLGKKHKNHPVNYDSTIIFPLEEMAKKYVSLFIKQLYEVGMLKKDQKYESSVISLATYLPPAVAGGQ